MLDKSIITTIERHFTKQHAIDFFEAIVDKRSESIENTLYQEQSNIEKKQDLQRCLIRFFELLQYVPDIEINACQWLVGSTKASKKPQFIGLTEEIRQQLKTEIDGLNSQAVEVFDPKQIQLAIQASLGYAKDISDTGKCSSIGMHNIDEPQTNFEANDSLLKNELTNRKKVSKPTPIEISIPKFHILQETNNTSQHKSAVKHSFEDIELEDIPLVEFKLTPSLKLLYRKVDNINLNSSDEEIKKARAMFLDQSKTIIESITEIKEFIELTEFFKFKYLDTYNKVAKHRDSFWEYLKDNGFWYSETTTVKGLFKCIHDHGFKLMQNLDAESRQKVLSNPEQIKRLQFLLRCKQSEIIYLLRESPKQVKDTTACSRVNSPV